MCFQVNVAFLRNIDLAFLFQNVNRVLLIFYNRSPFTTFAQENAKALAEAGGVLALVSMMNDIDEDEISKKASPH